MSDNLSYSVESVVFFLAILFLAFCCGLLRGLRQYFNKHNNNNVGAPSRLDENILVTHIRLRRSTSNDQHHDGMHSVYPGGPSSPPPYSVVSNDTAFTANIPPPSYDDVIKQNQQNNGTAPKTTDAAPATS